MLRLKLALEECGIKQKALCDATGFGKTQISLTLSTGKLPANAEKFRRGVFTLVAEKNGLMGWLTSHDMTAADLCKDAWEEETDPVLPLPSPATLPRLLCDIAGRAVLNSDETGSSEMIIRLARATSYLHRKMADMVGHDAAWTVRTEAEAAAILTGGSTC